MSRDDQDVNTVHTRTESRGSLKGTFTGTGAVVRTVFVNVCNPNCYKRELVAHYLAKNKVKFDDSEAHFCKASSVDSTTIK